MIRRALLSLLFPAALLAQTSPEALDVVPAGAKAYLFARTPLLVQAKLQGLTQRLGGKEADPLSQIQTRFGLRRLPVDRRGMALVFMEPLEQPESHPIVFLAVKDPKGLIEELKAIPGEGGLYAFKVRGEGRALALREGWVVLGDRGQSQSLRRASKGATPLRSALGDLAPWLESQDLSWLITGEGLWALAHEVRKQLGAHRPQTPAGAADPLTRAEQFFDQAQREVRFIGARADVDEHGNLKAVLRLQLQPQGQWAQISLGLEEAPDFGLRGLKGSQFTLAMGGALPKVWLTEAALLTFSLPNLGGEVSEAAQQARQEALDRVMGQVRGHHMAMLPPPAPPQQLIEVADAEAYFRELEAFYAMEGARSSKEAAAPKPDAAPKESVAQLTTQRRRVEDHEALAILAVPPGEGSNTKLPEGAAQLISLMVMEGPHAISLRTPSPLAESKGASSAPASSAPALSAAESLRAASALIPERAHFFAFMDLFRIQRLQEEGMAAMEATLTEAQRQALPPLPEQPAYPALGVALRFEPGSWELHLGLPWETQVGLKPQGSSRQKAVAARLAAVQQAVQDNGKAESPEDLEAAKGD